MGFYCRTDVKLHLAALLLGTLTTTKKRMQSNITVLQSHLNEGFNIETVLDLIQLCGHFGGRAAV